MRLVVLLAVTWLNLQAQTRQPRLLIPPSPSADSAQQQYAKYLANIRADTYRRRYPALIAAINKWAKNHNPDTISAKDLESYRSMVKAFDEFRAGMKEMGYR